MGGLFESNAKLNSKLRLKLKFALNMVKIEDEKKEKILTNS